MNKQHALLIRNLLVSQGWIDDADELLKDSESSAAARQKAEEVDALIELINPFLDRPLPVDTRLTWEGIEREFAQR